MLVEKQKVFDINNYLEEHRVIDDKEEKSIATSTTFTDVVEMVKNHFASIYSEEDVPSTEKVKRQSLEHKAILGEEEAEKILTEEIQTFLRENNLLGVKFPGVFETIQQAIYHELYRFGVFYKWKKFTDSPSAMIQGKEIWFKINGEFVKQEEELRDEAHISEIIRIFQVGSKRLKLNESNPQAEIETKDGLRIKIMIPPAALIPTIVFRRFVVKVFSFNEQANRQTIPFEDVLFFNNISNLYLNTIIAGEVESGKSTMLKTFYGARDPKKVAILIETSPETFLKRDFPDRLVHDFYTVHGDIKQVIADALRIDHDYLIVQEVRGVEAEGAIGGTERGTRGLLMTYHITDPGNTPIQLAQHIVDEFPNRRQVNEIRRIAKTLDIGITMTTMKGNKKKLTSLYEICFDINEDKAWINYLIVYNQKTGRWEYNSSVSEQLIFRMKKYNEELANEVLEHLKNRELKFPMQSEPIQNIVFKE